MYDVFGAHCLQEEPPTATKEKAKYTVRPPKDLSSQFLKLQEQKEKDRLAAEEKKKKEEEEARIAVRTNDDYESTCTCMLTMLMCNVLQCQNHAFSLVF